MKNLKLLLLFTVVSIGAMTIFNAVTQVVEARSRTIKIRVDSRGFSPSLIEVKAGQKLNLVFTRADENNCAGTVVFPKLNVRRNLTVGKDVTVSFTPTKAEQINFTCGMGMYKGQIVVGN